MGHFKMLKQIEMFRLKRAALNSPSPSSQAEDVLLSALPLSEGNLLSSSDSIQPRKEGEKFECCGWSSLQTHSLEKKKITTSQLQVPLMLNKVRVYQLYQIYQLFNRIDRGAKNQKQTVVFCAAPYLSGKDSRVLLAHLGDQRTNKSHKWHVLTDPAPLKVSTKTPWRIVSQAWQNVQFCRPCPASKAWC